MKITVIHEFTINGRQIKKQATVESKMIPSDTKTLKKYITAILESFRIIPEKE